MPSSAIGAAVVLVILVCYLLSLVLKNKIKLTGRAYSRGKDERLRSQIANSLEEARPIHLDVGNAFEGDLGGGSVLASMEATEAVSSQMAYADEPWAITGSAGSAAAFEKDAVQRGMENADYAGSFDADCAAMTGISAFTHTAGNYASLEKEPAALHLSVGAFGPAAALNDPLCSHGEVICAAGDDPVTQAVSMLTADEVYVGEQVYEIPDSLRRAERKNAALMTMDAARIAVVVVILIFTAAGLSGI